ncbi:MAG: prenyltransferase/squalene oxidase repeat-containing protein [Planctomycetota bacterium]
MPHFDTLPVRASDHFRGTTPFNERLYDHLKATPWWLASMGLHIVFALVASVFIRDTPAMAAPQPLAMTTYEDVTDLDPEIPPPEPLPTPPIEPPPEAPISPKESPQIDPETDTDQDNHENISDSRYDSHGPLDGPGTNGDIGIGGNAGGGPGFGGGRINLRGSQGGTIRKATDAGLEWLSNHQAPHGAWDCDGFQARCKKNICGGHGKSLYDVGVSGLSLLAFLGAGETHRAGSYKHVVRNGLKYLKGSQDAEGCFGARTSNHFTYNHGIAALAMAEAYGMTMSPLFKSSAQNGINFVTKCQNPYLAWRYGVKPQDNDTSVTGWMVMALKSGKMAGLDVDPDSFEGAVRWLDKVTEPEYGRAGYTARGNGPARPQELMDKFPTDKSESLTAVAVLSRIFCGADEKDEYVRKGADLMLRSLPVWDEASGSIDHYYWYYGTLAMFQVGGKHWEAWKTAMEPSILENQHLKQGDDRYGSWDPVGPWGPDGGRVYSTAVNVLNLEVYYRYERVFTGR